MSTKEKRDKRPGVEDALDFHKKVESTSSENVVSCAMPLRNE